MRSRWAAVGAIVLAPVLTGFDCGGGSLGGLSGAPSRTWTAPNGVTVAIATGPFALSITDARGKVLLESARPDDAVDAADPLRAYAPVAITHDTDESGHAIMYGWSYFKGANDPWKRAAEVASIDVALDHVTVRLRTSDPAHPALTITAEAQDSGVHLVASIDAGDPADPSPVNRVSLAFAMHDDDHFMGFGERFVRADHRGQFLYDWVEDGGFGQGEDTPPGPSNPSPGGEGQTNIPVPWFMNPRGFGLLLNTTWRSNFHLGDERADAWRVESTTGTLDMTVFADPDPAKLVASLTAVTGRPPAIADWVLAPRRRADDVPGEVAKLRAAHIPTSVIDPTVHYFPNGGGQDHAAEKAMTASLHAKGLKGVAYFCPFVADSWHPVFDEASAKGYLVKKADGSTYTVLDPPYNAGMVDFTNPEAVAWFQSFMQGALDDGWDGWMYDFAEYVPQDAVLFNGKSGMEMHNEYPVLYQEAAFDFFERQRPGDYLFFVRSGYAGTGGRVPMVWAGDQNTDFDRADGLPAALTGALNAGMSGIPLWGSDISGYHFLYNPPPDKEVYLRWTEVAAFSADMHDENDGTGNGTSADRWQIWKDQESQDVYRTYALLKTRMLPYVRLAVREARERGMPVMRHLYLASPGDPRVYAITDEYLYGDSLLVAPVVARGLTSRSVYLPEAQYFDYWTGARVTGAGDVIATAPLGVVPVYARVGAIVPMLSADVETVVPSTDGSVVSMQDRADFLEVQVFAGGQSSVTLDDGTTLSQSAPLAAFDPASPTRADGSPLVRGASAADLMTCDACYWDDPASHVFSIAVKTAKETLTAGPLVVGVQAGTASPSVKRYLFTVRH